MSTLTQQDRRWLDELVLQLRLRDVRGTAIGDAVAAVESHCLESGEPAAECFGDAREYADSLTFSPDQLTVEAPGEWVRVLAPVVCGVLGLYLVMATVAAARTGEQVQVTWGILGAAVGLAGFSFALTRWLEVMLRHPVFGALAVGTMFAATVALLVGVPQVAFVAPVAVMAIVCLALLGYSVIGQRRQGADPDDRVLDPRDGQDRYRGVVATVVTGLAPWALVLASAALGVLTWLTTS